MTTSQQKGRHSAPLFFALTRILRWPRRHKTALFHLPEEQCGGALALSQCSSVSTRAALPRVAVDHQPIRTTATSLQLGRIAPSFNRFWPYVFDAIRPGAGAGL